MLNFQLALVLCLSFYSCSTYANVNHFSYKFLSQESKGNAGNIIFSPASVIGALNIVLDGAKGDTKDQLEIAVGGQESSGVLDGLKKISRPESKDNQPLKIAEKIWVDDTTKVVDIFQKKYENEITEASFIKNSEEVRQQINDWVAKNADIKDLFKEGSIDSMTRLVLVNAISFKGLWKTPFEKQYTKKSKFMLEDGTKKKIDLMYQNGNFKMVYEDRYESVEVPYKGDEYNLLVTMPSKKSTKIDDFIAQMSQEKIQHIFDRMQLFMDGNNIARGGDIEYSQDIDLFLPKFMAKSEFDLKKSLTKMGVADLFEQGKADLSGITGDHSLYVSSAVHQAKIEMDEEGTKASAATGIGIAAMSLPPRFVVNRPFLFHILHKESGTIIFAGVVKDLGE
eukprot:TCONS_00061272-protein